MRIGVAGAGIAGLASSLALSGQGHDITVYEKRTGFGETGAGIQLSPNATRILLRFGLEGALGRTACEPALMRIRSLGSGREIGRAAFGPAMRTRFGAPYWAIARSDLHTALLDAVRSRQDVRLRVGRGVAGFTAEPDLVRLRLVSEAGAMTEAAADILIGADGLWSTVRPGLGATRSPRYGGYAAYRARVPAQAVPTDLAGDETGLWLGSGRHAVHYPIAAGQIVNLVVVARRPDEVAGWSGEADPGRIAAALAGAPASLQRLVAAADTWSAWSLYDLPAAPMANGRVALVGDAAHPVLPYLAQGGALAIEDAAELAFALARTPDRPADALRRYGRARRRRVRQVQRAAARNALAYHAAGPVAAIRNLTLRRMGPDGMAERYGWIYGWRPSHDEPAA